ncbi:MAG: hypothetical protein C0407_16745 [Desulfobacca sp.]|nr:hypothetical protein [Desulfobacca sp.]
MRGNKIRLVFSLWIISLVVACVTVNVYFPAKEVDKKAGEIVDDIRKKDSSPAPLGPQSSLEVLAAHWENYGLLFAQKESGGSNPVKQSLKTQIRERFPRLVPFFQKGAVGEGKTGFLEIRDPKNLSAPEKNDIKTLVEAENRDRQALYQEVAKSMNIQSDQLSKVQRIFAEKWQNSADKGWWIQKEDGQWVQK